MRLSALIFVLLLISCTVQKGQHNNQTIYIQDKSSLVGEKLILCKYYGDIFVPFDTASINEFYIASFHNLNLNKGMYSIYKNGNIIQLFLISDNQPKSFGIKLSSGNVQFKGSPENNDFVKYNSIINNFNDKITEKLIGKDSLMNLFLFTQNKQNELINKYPLSTLATYIKATSVDISQLQWEKPEKDYIINNFWKNIDLSDSSILNLPILPMKLHEYLSVIDPDDIEYFDSFIQKIKDPKIYTFSLEYFYNIFSLIASYEELTKTLLEKYIINNKNFEDKNDFYSLELKLLNINSIGDSIPNLILTAETGISKNLYNFLDKDKLTIIFFYDPDCDFCANEASALARLQNKNKVQVITICIDSIKFFKEFPDYWINMSAEAKEVYESFNIVGLPAIYLVKGNIIKAKNISVNKLSEYLK